MFKAIADFFAPKEKEPMSYTPESGKLTSDLEKLCKKYKLDLPVPQPGEYLLTAQMKMFVILTAVALKTSKKKQN